MTAFFTMLLVGFAAAGATSIIRAVVPTLWLLVKPFACDLCMSFWTSLVLTALLMPDMPVHIALGAVAVSIVTLKTIGHLSDIGTPPPTE